MAVECRDELGVKKSCQIVLIGSIALANEGMIANPLTNGLETASRTAVESRFAPLAGAETRLKPRANSKKHLERARAAKRDEFYTQYKDIKRELELYYQFNPNVFRGKVILLPCDNPRKSYFNRYFLDKYCPEQFELVRFRKGDDGKDLTLNGKPPYFRILIRARKR